VSKAELFASRSLPRRELVTPTHCCYSQNRNERPEDRLHESDHDLARKRLRAEQFHEGGVRIDRTVQREEGQDAVENRRDRGLTGAAARDAWEVERSHECGVIWARRSGASIGRGTAILSERWGLHPKALPTEGASAMTLRLFKFAQDQAAPEASMSTPTMPATAMKPIVASNASSNGFTQPLRG